jgi:hypothetical protein
VAEQLISLRRRGPVKAGSEQLWGVLPSLSSPVPSESESNKEGLTSIKRADFLLHDKCSRLLRSHRDSSCGLPRTGRNGGGIRKNMSSSALTY